ncbi:MAG: hypothetical protein KAG10_04070 [Methylococcales bacterium]|nr:hypothetical protein [Methylococcales bacterium]MCK5925048.1 hypothetical protein [Methylococcales bacterium]
MTYAAINILVLSAFLLILGMYKPKLLLFWQDKPSRLTIIVVVTVLVMIGGTLFGEGTRQKQIAEEAAANKKAPQVPVKPESDLPLPLTQ